MSDIEIQANEILRTRVALNEILASHTGKTAEEIAKAKMPDLTAAGLEAAVRTIAGSARSMGVDVEGL